MKYGVGLQLLSVTFHKIRNFLFHKSKTGCPENRFPDPVHQPQVSSPLDIFDKNFHKKIHSNWTKFTTRC